MSDFLVEAKGTTTWITLNRPDARNALSFDMNIALGNLAQDLDQDDNVRAVVFTGTGDKAFSAGADLKERRGVPARESAPYINAISSAIAYIGAIRKPTICALNGSAFGGGLELAIACDFRIAVEGCEVGLTEVRLGIMPGAGGTQRLPRLIGEARAKEMIMLGRRVPIARALEIGLVHSVVARGQLHAAVEALLAELAGCAPLGVIRAKSALERGAHLALDQGLEIERECYDTTLFSEDRDEGLLAFAEGRTPKFRGR